MVNLIYGVCDLFFHFYWALYLNGVGVFRGRGICLIECFLCTIIDLLRHYNFDTMGKGHTINGMSFYHSAAIACILIDYGIWFLCKIGPYIKMLFGRGCAIAMVL